MTTDDTGEHASPHVLPPAAAAKVGPVDVELALARALDEATARGAFDAIPALVDELRARRLERTGVPDLETERARRRR